MKKYFVLLILLFIFPVLVNASSATCVYKYETTTINVYYKYGSEIDYDVTYANNNSNYQVKAVNIKNSDIVDLNGNISCPNVNITRESTGQRNRWKITLTASSNGAYDPEDEIINDDGAEKQSPSANTHACIYHKGEDTEYSLVWNNNKVEVNKVEVGLRGSRFSSNCEIKIDGFTANDFKNGICPDDFYDTVVTRQDICRLIISKNPIVTDKDSTTDPDDIEDVYDPDSNINILIPNVPDLTNCESLFGDPDDTGSTSWYLVIVFRVLKYVAIILLVVLSIMDFVSAVAASDNDALKKATSKAIKRFILCIIIFVLPTLIELILEIIHDEAIGMCGIGGD